MGRQIAGLMAGQKATEREAKIITRPTSKLRFQSVQSGSNGQKVTRTQVKMCFKIDYFFKDDDKQEKKKKILIIAGDNKALWSCCCG